MNRLSLGSPDPVGEVNSYDGGVEIEFELSNEFKKTLWDFNVLFGVVADRKIKLT